MDWLLQTALSAIIETQPELERWARDKEHEGKNFDRFESLRFICFDLDAENRRIVAERLGVTFEQLEAVRSVLRKI
ncbi:hypothetical protein EGI20_08710 [Aquitalea sp. S1-19]|nr:hypothetical protein [Aquitalea sp. S1-19]